MDLTKSDAMMACVLVILASATLRCARAPLELVPLLVPAAQDLNARYEHHQKRK